MLRGMQSFFKSTSSHLEGSAVVSMHAAPGRTGVPPASAHAAPGSAGGTPASTHGAGKMPALPGASRPPAHTVRLGALASRSPVRMLRLGAQASRPPVRMYGPGSASVPPTSAHVRARCPRSLVGAGSEPTLSGVPNLPFLGSRWLKITARCYSIPMSLRRSRGAGTLHATPLCPTQFLFGGLCWRRSKRKTDQRMREGRRHIGITPIESRSTRSNGCVVSW